MRFLLLAVFLGLTVHAQSSQQPEKESSSDLRSGILMFSIQNLEDEVTYRLERTANEDYFLKLQAKGDEKLHKLSSRDAKKLDMEFAAKFLKALYELPPSPEGCKATLKLTMKGESQDVCGKDEKKTQEFLPFAHELGKRF